MRPSRPARSARPGRSRVRPRAESFALLALVLLLLALPAWLAPRVEAPRFEHLPIEPLLIDVESAAWYEWATLDGIGEARGQRIVDWIQSHGPLGRLEDLEAIGGMPRGWLERARPYLKWQAPGAGGDVVERAEATVSDPDTSGRTE